MKEESGINSTNPNPMRALAESLFFENDEKTGNKRLSVFGGIVAIFACIALVGGFPYRAYSHLKVKGKKL